MSDKRTYEIGLHGCDDSTLMRMELTSAESGLLRRVAKLSEETSTYGCMPTLEVMALPAPSEEVNPVEDGED